MKYIFILFAALITISCSNVDELKNSPLKFIKVDLGGCNNQNKEQDINKEQARNFVQETNDTIIFKLVNDTLTVDVEINYTCCASMQAISSIEKDTVLLLISDITELSTDYCRCTCFYTFDYYFTNLENKEYTFRAIFDAPNDENDKELIQTLNI
jgi:hypothetical protein